jgi:hypothetical protein
MYKGIETGKKLPDKLDGVTGGLQSPVSVIVDIPLLENGISLLQILVVLPPGIPIIS